jgi:Rod binding domain-containing protein
VTGSIDIGDLYARYQAERRDEQSLSRRLTAKAQSRPSGASAGSKPRPIDRQSPLYRVCQDFEALFVKQMLNVMRKTVNKSGLLDGGMAEDIFEDMLYDEYALSISRYARLGLSDMLYKQLDAGK